VNTVEVAVIPVISVPVSAAQPGQDQAGAGRFKRLPASGTVFLSFDSRRHRAGRASSASAARRGGEEGRKKR
jgi:hypothetical protein